MDEVTNGRTDKQKDAQTKIHNAHKWVIKMLMKILYIHKD